MPKIKKESIWVTQFPKVLRPRPLTFFDLRPDKVLYHMKGLIKLHNPVKFLEDSSFGSHFRGLQMLALRSF